MRLPMRMTMQPMKISSAAISSFVVSTGRLEKSAPARFPVVSMTSLS